LLFFGVLETFVNFDFALEAERSVRSLTLIFMELTELMTALELELFDLFSEINE